MCRLRHIIASLLLAPASADLTVPIIWRDFTEAHVDFEDWSGGVVTGLVENALGTNGLPVRAAGSAPALKSDASFAQWYTDVGGSVNRRVDGTSR